MRIDKEVLKTLKQIERMWLLSFEYECDTFQAKMYSQAAWGMFVSLLLAMKEDD